MDLGLESDLNVEVEIEPEAERVALAAALLLGSLASYSAESVCHAADEAASCLPDVAKLEVVERALPSLLLLLLLLALTASSLRGSIVGLLLVGFVDLSRLLLLPLGLL
jgi:hypothetical protein